MVREEMVKMGNEKIIWWEPKENESEFVTIDRITKENGYPIGYETTRWATGEKIYIPFHRIRRRIPLPSISGGGMRLFSFLLT